MSAARRLPALGVPAALAVPVAPVAPVAPVVPVVPAALVAPVVPAALAAPVVLAGLAVLAVLAVLGGRIARRRLVLVSVRGESMRPTYASGDVLLGLRTAAPRRGQVVVFRPPYPGDGPPYRVKRVAALPGDPVPEWVARPASATVPAGHVVVRGDAERSEDSRHYGYVPHGNVVAVVLARLRSAAAGRAAEDRGAEGGGAGDQSAAAGTGSARAQQQQPV